MTDKFYTKASTARILLQAVDLSGYDLIVEPSAGAGAISLPLQEILARQNRSVPVLAVDIAPDHDSIQQCDFLRDTLAPVQQAHRCLMIGNPPFGRGKTPLAVQFFNRAAGYASVQTIAFIVPRSFRKDSVQDRLDRWFHLTKEVEIPRNSFTFQGRSYPVYCVIQVWQRRPEPRVRAVQHRCNGKYQFLPESALPAENVIVIKRVGTRAGHCWFMPRLSQESGYSAGAHFFVQSLSIPVETMFLKVQKVCWSRNNTMGQPSLTKNEVIRELNRITQSSCDEEPHLHFVSPGNGLVDE